MLSLAGCGESITEDPDISVVDVQAGAGADVTEAVQEKWRRSCALCHLRGEGGAPRTGDPLAWRYRLTEGRDSLLRNTITGLNRMPPLGYCMDCSEDDFIVMIRMMAGDGQ